MYVFKVERLDVVCCYYSKFVFGINYQEFLNRRFVLSKLIENILWSLIFEFGWLINNIILCDVNVVLGNVINIGVSELYIGWVYGGRFCKMLVINGIEFFLFEIDMCVWISYLDMLYIYYIGV